MNKKDKIRMYFYNAGPNTITMDHLNLNFPDFTEEEINKHLKELIQEGIVRDGPFVDASAISEFLNTIPEKQNYSLNPKYLGVIPIETQIQVGRFKINRHFTGGQYVAEDANIIYSCFDRILEDKLKQLKKEYSIEIRKLWGTLTTIFAIFVTLFSIINFGIKPLYTVIDGKLSNGQIIYQSLLNLVPLTCVLFIFLLFLYLIFRGK